MRFSKPSPFTIGITTVLVICGVLLVSGFTATENSVKQIFHERLERDNTHDLKKCTFHIEYALGIRIGE